MSKNKFKNKVLISFVASIFLYSNTVLAQESSWDNFLNVLLGKELSYVLSLGAANPNINSEELNNIVQQLEALADEAEKYKTGENNQDVNFGTKEEQTKVLKKLHSYVDVAKKNLDEFSKNVAAGEYDEFIDQKFWKECQSVLTQTLAKTKDATNNIEALPEEEFAAYIKNGPNAAGINDKLQTDLDDCQTQAKDLSKSLDFQISMLTIEIGKLDKEIDEIDEKLKDDKLTPEERKELEKEKGEKEKKKEENKEQKEKAEEAKKGNDLWLLISGILNIVIGVLLVVFSAGAGITVGWAMISGGIALTAAYFDDSKVPNAGGNDNPGPGKANGKDDSGDTQLQGTVKTALAENGPGGIDPKEFEDENFKISNPKEAGEGNIVLLYSKLTNEIKIKKADSKEDILLIKLKEVREVAGLIPNGFNLESINSISNWQFDTESKAVVLNFESELEGIDIPIALAIEEKSKNNFVIFQRVAPEK